MIVKASKLSQNQSASGIENLKVLHLINGEHFSGAERVQDLLALAMPRFGYEVGFACVKPGKFPGVRDSQDCQLFETPMKSRLDVCVPAASRLYSKKTAIA